MYSVAMANIQTIPTCPMQKKVFLGVLRNVCQDSTPSQSEEQKYLHLVKKYTFNKDQLGGGGHCFTPYW